MPRSDYATCFSFFKKFFIQKTQHTPRNRRHSLGEADNHLLNHTAAHNFVKIRA